VTRTFHHIGLPTETPQPHESWVEKTRVWVSNPNLHPQKVEWLRYAPDSTVDDDFRNSPHIAYTVESLDDAIAGKDILLEPGQLGEPPFGRAAFTMEDGIIVEYIQLFEGRAWFDDDLGS
jgi:hypothetical protein